MPKKLKRLATEHNFTKLLKHGRISLPAGVPPPQVLAIIAFALIGSILLFRSYAATPTANLQAENGTLSGAIKGVDTTASAGQYTLFGQGTATTVRYEAENSAVAQHNVTVNAAAYASPSGNGAVLGNFGNIGKFLTFTVTVPSNGSYPVVIRYASAYNTDDTAHLLTSVKRTMIINSGSGTQLSFDRTDQSSPPNWNSLQTKSLGNLTLNSGSNTIRFQIDQDDYQYWDVDYLEVTGANGTPTPPPPPPTPPPPTPTPPPPPPIGSYALPPYNIPSNAVHVSDGGQLSNAINSASAGTTIVVHSGSYGDTYIQGKNPGGWLRIIGDPAGGRVAIGHVKFVNSSYIELRHLKISGNGQVANKAVEVHGGHHFRVYDNEITNGGEAGMSFPGNQGPGGTDHIDIRFNDVHNNAHNSNQGWWQGSGLSILFSQDRGVEDVVSGYKILIAGNRMWNNFIDPVISGGILDPWGVTDGNCIIIDVNKNYNYQGRTLVTNNICSDNGGVGVAVTNSGHVDIIRNSLYQNVKTRLDSVQNNGEIMCAGSNGSFDVKVIGNLVVPRGDNPNLFQTHGICSNYEVSGNMWVRTGYSAGGSGNVTVNSGTQVFSAPNLNASAGNWTPVGPAVGFGAQWPQ